MNHTPSAAQLLAEIARIQSMEFGKLSEYQRPGRAKDSATYLRLQIWQDGRNISRHVRPEELPALRDAIEGYARFCALTQQYAQLVVHNTRARLEEGVKKKIQPYSRHCRKKSSDS